MTADDHGSAGATRFGSDLAVGLLSSLGIEALALNPGATIRGLHDSIVHGPPGTPELITCLHEEIAVAFAHGYARAAGRPMAVGLHDTVGLLHGAMGIFNAWVDRAPMVVLVGTGPVDAHKRRPWIDWIHTVTDQGEIVRDYSVWNDQPASLEALARSIQRGFRAAVGTPGGPALISLDVSLQEAAADTGSWTPRQDLTLVARVGPDDRVVEEIVRRLHAARRPLLVTDRQLSSTASATLVRLAETSGALIFDMGIGNVPVGHPHDVTDNAAEALDACDLIVFVDVRDPGWALGRVDLASRRMSGHGAAVPAVGIGLDDLRGASWMVSRGDEPAQLTLTSEPELALDAIADIWGSQERALAPGYGELVQRTSATEGPVGGPDERLGRGALAASVAAAVGGFDYVIANGVLRGSTRRAFRPAGPERFLGIAEGAGQGYGLPASIGAAYALRDSAELVIDLQGDGDMLYTPQALWTLANLGLGLLVVVDANRKYGQDALHQKAMESLRGRSSPRPMAGIDLTDPPIGIAAMARSFGVDAYGPIVSRDELSSVMPEAVARVLGGEPIVIEVVTADD